ncbi:DUF3885 domain-containing protein [Pseudomonas sp. SDO5532_S415]
MNLELEIGSVFGGKAFVRPLFYSYPGGLRFELSEIGGAIEQFLSALRKSTKICSDIFAGETTLVACLRIHSGSNPFAHRAVIHDLRSAGIEIPTKRSVWRDEIDPSEWYCENEPEYWINAAFEAPVTLLQAILWCALAKDFAVIQPKPRCDFYLFNLKQRIVAFPYDDRGMDVIGPNTSLLLQLYRRHHADLLDHDRPLMDITFAKHAI